MGVHDLEKYPEIKRLLNIPEDEPIFILRAQDVLYRPMLSVYEQLYMAAVRAQVQGEFLGGATEPTQPTDAQQNFADDIDEDAERARNWQRRHADRVKIPD